MNINNILDEFADGVTEINISNKNIKGTLDFTRFSKLIKLNCDDNLITSLYNLPNSLIELCCSYNQITSLDNLPTSLIKLYCYRNNITNLDNLPNSLKILDCCNNKITTLDNLVPKGTEAFSSKKTFQIH
jgi:Leucine-rich repeat (LRR) protein